MSSFRGRGRRTIQEGKHVRGKLGEARWELWVGGKNTRRGVGVS